MSRKEKEKKNPELETETVPETEETVEEEPEVTEETEEILDEDLPVLDEELEEDGFFEEEDPETGDHTNVTLWICLGSAGIVGLAVVGILSKKRISGK